MNGGDLHHPAVDAALATAAGLVGMEVVFVAGLTDDEFAFARVRGQIPGVDEGRRLPRADSFCHRMLAGAPHATADAGNDPAYADAPARAAFGITSYVGVPVRGHDGAVVGTLCGVDRGSIAVRDEIIPILATLAGVVSAHVNGAGHAVIRRTDTGWHVGTDTEDDLLAAMVLADLLTGDMTPVGRPQRPHQTEDEVDRLRVAVSQLEHALAARVTIEQAIGVIAERQHLSPRASFERLRKAARSRGKKVHDVARMVVASVNDPTVPLPPELAPRRA
ncbi:MAG TPA: ANTAR domain-containing protein [Mycobacteriales bacterium]|nr:ANTAR domain-containing protein [Mycobacteriales bacterium]